MTDSVQRFLSELIQAANQVELLTNLERANLLRRAAGTIRDYRDEINFGDAPANDRGQGDIVHSLSVMAETVEFVMPEQIAGALLEVVETVKDLRILLDAKHEIGK